MDLADELYQKIEPLDMVKALEIFDDESIKEVNNLLKEKDIDLKIIEV